MALLIAPPPFLCALPPPDVTVNLVILLKSPPTSAWRPNFGLTHGRYFTECAARLPVRVLHGLSVSVFVFILSGVVIKKRSARSIDGLTARKARKNNRRAAGLDAAAARLEGARPGSPEGGPG